MRYDDRFLTPLSTVAENFRQGSPSYSIGESVTRDLHRLYKHITPDQWEKLCRSICIHEERPPVLAVYYRYAAEYRPATEGEEAKGKKEYVDWLEVADRLEKAGLRLSAHRMRVKRERGTK